MWMHQSQNKNLNRFKKESALQQAPFKVQVAKITASDTMAGRLFGYKLAYGFLALKIL
ncbi:hypothetical protein BN341_6970 [Helicobacter heilmannii ASB1.4]|uniref:Uncharacterized protein n=1 Tax=Helicobacter heilmannii TaxID=35817 RepID=A0A0K2Y6B7_HELHE|nr:hypothetical protein BN341_6970 [Helicobacter heilmannii ASB1.4]CRI34403.1 hypothetical protein HHE01_12490 [Helicobacter heilmannii]